MEEKITEVSIQGDALTERPAPLAPRPSFYVKQGKRLLDLALGIPLFVGLVPIMLLVGLAVLVTSGWPVFYGSERLGRGGSRFSMWKFRTMVRDADLVLERWKESHPELAEEYATNYKLQHDPRITPLGGILRKTALDELPQLWNVLRGQMSLVGPRPYLPTLAPYPGFEEAIFSVKPGVTGPWQVQGRNNLPPLTRMELDQEYASDVRISKEINYLLRTFKTLMDRDGV